MVVQTSHALATGLNVIQTSHSYGDLMLLMKAIESKQVWFFCLIFMLVLIYLVYRYLYLFARSLPNNVGKVVDFQGNIKYIIANEL